jgi:hypothetical protein
MFTESAAIQGEIPSWTNFCLSSPFIDVPRPLLYQELVTEADGPFCAGGREFREAPAIYRHESTLHLEGFVIDTIETTHDTTTNFRDDEAQLDHKGYSDFGRRRRWFRTSGGLAVLGPERAEAGSLLTILIGGKTPYLLERDHKEGSHFRLIGEWYVNTRSF